MPGIRASGLRAPGFRGTGTSPQNCRCYRQV
jgi:hypothetical protein